MWEETGLWAGGDAMTLTDMQSRGSAKQSIGRGNLTLEVSSLCWVSPLQDPTAACMSSIVALICILYCHSLFALGP